MPVERLLTDIKVRNAKPQSKPCRLLDGGGLYLVVMPTGRKLWRFRYRVRVTGKPTELTLGSYPATDLAGARRRRDERRKELEAGTDPSQARRERKRNEKIKVENTFGAVVTEWLELRRKEWRPHYAAIVQSIVERLLLPALEHRPIVDIDAPEILAVLRKIPTPLMQVKTRTIASQIFRYAVASSRAKFDPAVATIGALGRHEAATFPTLNPSRLPKFLRDLDHYGEQLPEHFARTRLRISQIATKLLMLTFLRSTELRLAEWCEIDFDKAMWTVPGERMKKTRKRKAGQGDHLVPLSRQALELLRELKTLARGSAYVFPAARNKGEPINKHVTATVLKTMGYAGQMSNHGFRHLASTMLNEAYDVEGNRRFDADVIERQLSHIAGGVRGVYNKAQYLPQRVKLMQAWADMLDEARRRGDGGNVVSIGSKRRTAA